MKSIKLLGLVFLIATCTSRTEYIEGHFIGSQYGSGNIYEFKKDGTFKLRGRRTFEIKDHVGRYAISDSVILLNWDTDNFTSYSEMQPRLKIINSECIRDFDNNFYCINSSTVDSLNKIEYKFQEGTTSILDELDLVKEERRRMATKNSNNRDKYGNFVIYDVSVFYNGIVVMGRKEFHSFSVHKTDSSHRNPRAYLNFLVSKRPFEVYQVVFADSLSLVYKADH